MENSYFYVYLNDRDQGLKHMLAINTHPIDFLMRVNNRIRRYHIPFWEKITKEHYEQIESSNGQYNILTESQFFETSFESIELSKIEKKDRLMCS